MCRIEACYTLPCVLLLQEFADKLWKEVDFSPDCWNWQGGTSHGYGTIRAGYEVLKTHRLAYMLLVGPIPEDKELDHTCGNKICCNPKHLEIVTHPENMLRYYREGE